MEKILITPEGLEKINSDLNYLKGLKPGIIDEISKARVLGDLAENAEYHEAKKYQSFVEGKIAELESVISCAEVVDPSTLGGTHVTFGATVTLEDQENSYLSSYKIVGHTEADIDHGTISMYSPLGSAVMGKEEGEYLEVSTPGGEKVYKLVKLEFK